MLRAVAEVMAQQQLHTWKPQHLSNTAWAFATLAFNPGQSLLAQICLQAEWKAADFRAQQTVNLAWSLATFSYSAMGLLEKLVAHLERRRHQITAESLVTLLWSYATLRCHPWRLMSVLQAEMDVASLPPAALANLLWSYATLGHRPVPQQMVTAAAQVAERKAAEIAPCDASQMVWALATLEHHPGHLLDLLAATVEGSLYSMPPEQLANLVWAYSKLDHFAGALLERAAVATRSRVFEFDLPALSTLVWSYGRWAGQVGFAEEAVSVLNARMSDAAALQHMHMHQAVAQQAAQYQLQSQLRVQMQFAQQMTALSLGPPGQASPPSAAIGATEQVVCGCNETRALSALSFGLSPAAFSPARPMTSSVMQPTAVSAGVLASYSDSTSQGLHQQRNLLPAHAPCALRQPGFQWPMLYPLPPQTPPIGLQQYFSPELGTQRASAFQPQANAKALRALPAETHLSAEHTLYELEGDNGDINGVVVGQGRRERARSYSAPHVATPPRSRAFSSTSDQLSSYASKRWL